MDGILYGLVIGWILRWFNIDDICINVLQPLFTTKLTADHYYFVCGLMGLIGELIARRG